MDLWASTEQQPASRIRKVGAAKPGHRRQALLLVLVSALVGAAVGIGNLLLI